MKGSSDDMVTLKPIGEILGMSGPWIAELIINNLPTSLIVLDQPIIYNQTHNQIALGVYNKERHSIYFKISIVDFKTAQIYSSRQKFEMLYIEEFTDDQLTIFLAFHNNLKEYKSKIIFNSENFELLKLPKNNWLNSGLMDN